MKFLHITKRDMTIEVRLFFSDEIIEKAIHRQNGPFQMQLPECHHPFLFRYKLPTKLPKILELDQ